MIPEDHFVLFCWFTGMFCFGFIFGFLAAWSIIRKGNDTHH